MRYAPNAAKASKAAKAGLVFIASGLAAFKFLATVDVPKTIDADVQA